MNFLEIPEIDFKKYEVFRAAKYSEMNPSTRKKLSEFFKPYNEKLYKLIEQVGEDICILKIHSDIITDFYRDYKFNRNELNKLKIKYNFKIWEDRKLADIGCIDIISAHSDILV